MISLFSSHHAQPQMYRQQGNILSESLIALLLFSIAGLGITHITSEVLVGQREAKIQQLTINELRSLVIGREQPSAMCDNQYKTTFGNTAIAIEQGCAATSATVNGVTIEDVRPPLVLSTSVNNIGEIRVGGYGS